MTLRQLQILRALVRHRTTVAAAEELALSQPAISNALKVMEAQAGFALFHRINNRLFPTAEVLSLHEEGEAIFALHAKLEGRMRDLRESRSGHLAIMNTPPLAYSVIPPGPSRRDAPWRLTGSPAVRCAAAVASCGPMFRQGRAALVFRNVEDWSCHSLSPLNNRITARHTTRLPLCGNARHSERGAGPGRTLGFPAEPEMCHGLCASGVRHHSDGSQAKAAGMTARPLWQCSAHELTASFIQGEATPADALDSVLVRLEAINGVLNAVVTTDLNGARQAALASTARWRNGKPLSPLDGVPVSVKDNLFVGGLRATWGSLLFTDHVAARDDLPVAALRAAGAVILGKTNTPELALSGHTDNRLFGSTGNPWDPSRSAGGSSGGAVAAVGGGLGPLALATDAGGSIRRPAGLTGVVGLKPGLGRVSRRHGFPPLAHDLQVIGPIGRCVADVCALFYIIATAPSGPAPQRPLRIATFDGFPGSSAGTALDPCVRTAFTAALDVLRGLGHRVEAVAPFWDPDEVGALFTGLSAAGVARVVRDIPGWEECVTPSIAALARAGYATSATEYVALLDQLTSFRWRVRDHFAEWDVAATPTSATAGWPRTDSVPATINARAAHPRAAASFSTAVNAAGLPALSIPAPVPTGAMPVGLQLVGPPGGDEMLLLLAAAYEAASPWPQLAIPFLNSGAI